MVHFGTFRDIGWQRPEKTFNSRKDAKAQKLRNIGHISYFCNAAD